MSNNSQIISGSLIFQLLRGFWRTFVSYGPIFLLIAVAYGLGRTSNNNMVGFTYVFTAWIVISSFIKEEIHHAKMLTLIESNSKEVSKEVKRILSSYKEKRDATQR